MLAIPRGKSDSVDSMKIRAAFMTLLVGVVTFGIAGCGSRGPNKVMADTPVLPYQAPDISEITGIEEPDESDAEDASAPEANK